MRLRDRHYHEFNLNILAIAHVTKAKYFKLLKKSARYHILKKSCKTVHQMGMLKKVLENWKQTASKQKRVRAMGKFLVNESSKNIIMFSMKFWIFRTRQKQLLRLRLDH